MKKVIIGSSLLLAGIFGICVVTTLLKPEQTMSELPDVVTYTESERLVPFVPASAIMENEGQIEIAPQTVLTSEEAAEHGIKVDEFEELQGFDDLLSNTDEEDLVDLDAWVTEQEQLEAADQDRSRATVIAVISDIDEDLPDLEDLLDDETEIVSNPKISPILNAASNVPTDLQEKISTNYYKIPENVRTYYETNVGQIIVKSNTIQDYRNLVEPLQGRSIKGFTYFVNNTIYIDNRYECLNTVNHEMGHVIDNILGFPSSSYEFADIHDRELSNFCKYLPAGSGSKYNWNTALEYFASAFEEAALHPDLMKQYCPESYNYVMDCANRF